MPKKLDPAILKASAIQGQMEVEEQVRGYCHGDRSQYVHCVPHRSTLPAV